MFSHSVVVRRESVVFPTYEPLPPDKNPLFLEKRVYQGSSGRVYPLPAYNRISEKKADRAWDAVIIENEYIYVMILPEIGGRIHVGRDKTNGYEFFYRQNVIKPALVGLAGPWASGGVEFNWPQHHRPATWMPVEVEIERHPDGSATVWLSDHDPMERLKGMHGVHLAPGVARIELKMRAYNRTPFVQTFLWWANVAVHVHEAYQSFFPPDVKYVADHAKRAISRFPLCEDRYYGVDYARRAREGVPVSERPTNFVPPHSGGASFPGLPDYAPNDLSWYANIPVPTSYMCLGSQENFSGGYDFRQQAGLVQISNHHISPGKKQWTWGNHDFGYAWDRLLTDSDGPYAELMLGVYTDNQPDFSFLQPGESKTWSVYWYPIQKIGPAQKANEDAALSLRVEGGQLHLGLATVQRHTGLRVVLTKSGAQLGSWQADVAPDQPFVTKFAWKPGESLEDLCATVSAQNGVELLSYRVQPDVTPEPPQPATEPLPPSEVKSADELYTIGLHLWQYRHATRSPAAYWEEALARDPLDARCNTGLGVIALRRGEFAKAENYFRTAIRRITSRNPNPYDGEPYYQLAVTLRYLDRDTEAYDAAYKAVWNQAWQSAGYHLLAQIDATRGDWPKAFDHLQRSLRLNTDNLRARNLAVIALRRLGRNQEADTWLQETRRLDPLDVWSRHLAGLALEVDDAMRIDLAWDYAQAGLLDEAISVLSVQAGGAHTLLRYHRGYLLHRHGQREKAKQAFLEASVSSTDYVFPSRLEEIAVLETARVYHLQDAQAAYLLGNLYYDRRRYEEAIALWEESTRSNPKNSIAWRNLGIAYFNTRADQGRAWAAYERALEANPRDARLAYERDQLWKRIGTPVDKRLRELELRLDLVAERDDATVELCALYLQAGRAADALRVLESRIFQPWEGGEGQALAQYTRARITLARAALADGRAEDAVTQLKAALTPPDSLGEKRHLLANQSDVFFWLGEAYLAAGHRDQAREAWRRAAEFRGDFQEMSVKAYSEMSYFSGRAMERLGETEAARALFVGLCEYAEQFATTPAKVDYFATSLPTLLLFNDDLQARQKTQALFLRAQAEIGLKHQPEAIRLLQEVLTRDPGHASAADLLEELEALTPSSR